ncbi:D-tagatose-bisphosphate aldolase, class II, non-catalytic subunit [Pseudoprimorskyibacter insulae]|uniref:D-tagatose-1,6-bisphosphate aldolase subunit KbaZ n=1 Tax=Pseudoprimorskyibacter insulae TaxID=1695997 RepID=A0A2R8AX97_9RHOB|nr:D-tagatose-bisphosphate aldolase, class II, non-catalytic subunit [Pseudoprimorskyibacter insulae]SPF80652.1 D-tagatose-1,6-bisphosphate aldolase subunit KbaZ [Pseudoprimorskyibacter insulae]
MALLLDDLAPCRRNDLPRGITSVCSAHPLVLRAALRHGRDTGETVLIEATCNQVNHQGGYTGMRPTDFRDMVTELARQENCPEALIVLGGDHLGPNPWRHLSADLAMAEAAAMIEAYVLAGFRKIHLDASMGCAGEPEALDDDTCAMRAVQLAAVAERAADQTGGPRPRYIIGTEVPPPGGADHVLDTVPPTDPEAARQTIAIHRRAFANAGLEDAFARVLGIVVQPGVEFGNHNVIAYDPAAAKALSRILDDEPDLVFEAHSTDYQGVRPLSDLIRDGFAILKVGPELTFILREALYALDLIASDLLPDYGDRPLMHAMEALMCARSGNWSRHYSGASGQQRLLRHYSLSDRIRYYWAQPEAEAAVATLFNALRGQKLPRPLLWQHMPAASHFADTPFDPEALVIWRIRECLRAYSAACASQLEAVA